VKLPFHRLQLSTFATNTSGDLRYWRWAATFWCLSLLSLWTLGPHWSALHDWQHRWLFTQFWLWVLIAAMALFAYRRRVQPQAAATRMHDPKSAHPRDSLAGLHTDPGTHEKPCYLLLNPMAVDAEGWLQQVNPLLPPYRHRQACPADWPVWYGEHATLIQPKPQEIPAGALPYDPAWLSLYAELRRARPRQPLHGIILLLHPGSWLGAEQESQPAVIQALIQRLEEIAEQLQIRPLLYCYVTHLATMEGYGRWLQELKGHPQQQLLGIQFSRHEAAWRDEFRQFWLQWHEQLAQALPRLWLTNTEASTRASLFRFQQQLQSLEHGISHWLEQLLAATSRIQLRGCYLGNHGDLSTRSELVTPDAHPNENLSATIDRRYQLIRNDSAVNHKGVGTPSFITRFLSDAVLPESALAPIAANDQRRQQRHRRSMLIGMLICSVALLVGWQYFYHRNRTHGDQLLSVLTSEQPVGLATQSPGETSLAQRLLALDRLLATQNEWPGPSTLSWFHGLHEMGLEQASRLRSGVQQRYLNQLYTSLLPSLMVILQRHMTAAKPGSVEKLQLLTLMRILDDPEGHHPEWVTRYLQNHLPRLFGTRSTDTPALNLEDQQRLLRHVQRILQETDWASRRAAGDRQAIDRYAPFASPIQQAQHELQLISAPQRLYQQLSLIAAGELGPDLDLRHLLQLDNLDADEELSALEDTDALADGERLPPRLPLVSSDGATLQIPPLFTLRGWQFLNAQEPGLLQQAALDGWVLGETSRIELTGAQQQSIVQQVRQLYRQQANAHWTAALDSLSLQPARSKEELLQQVAQFTHPTQPLQQFLQRLGSELEIAPPRPTSTPQSLPEQSLSDQALLSAAVTPSSLTAVPVLQPLMAFLQPQGEQAPAIQQLHQDLLAVQQYLLPLLAGSDQGRAALAALQHTTAPSPLRQLQLNTASLPTPLDIWFATWGNQADALLKQEALQALDRQWQQQVVSEYQQRIANRYPFAPNATQEVTLADMEHFFAPQGTFDQFYQQQLAPWLAASELDPAPDRDLAGLDEPAPTSHGYQALLTSIDQVAQIRQQLFNPEGKLEMNFWLQPLALSANKRRSILDLDGQLLDYSHDAGLRVALVWPNAPDGAGVSKLTLIPTERDRSPRSISTNGPWALFRLLQQGHSRAIAVNANSQPDGAIDGIELEFTVEGGSMRYRLSTASGALDMDLFSHFRLPDTLGDPR
jgi:type VI secretion system protein ImpL